MKKLFITVLAVASALLFSSCTPLVTADGMISWGVGFSGSFSEMSQAITINKVYRSVFAEYGVIAGEEESTGSYCIIKGATSKDQVSGPFTSGIEAANARLQSEYSYTISTTKPGSEVKYYTLDVDYTWSDSKESRTYYLTR